MMAVNIDERKLSPLDLVFLGDQRGLWLVLVDRRHLLLFRSLVLLRRCGARPNEERGKCGNKNDGNKSGGSPVFHSAPCFPGLPPYFPIGRRISTPESSATIGGDAASQAFPFPSARGARPRHWFSSSGDRRGHRTAGCRPRDWSFFSRLEA